MLWTEEMFKVKKPIIAMLHLDPLPGDPRYRYGDCMEKRTPSTPPSCSARRSSRAWAATVSIQSP